MSHTTTIDTGITNIEVLKAICQENGWRMLTEGFCGLYADSFHADHRIQVNEKVIAGLIKQDDGSYKMKYDLYQSGLTQSQFEEMLLQRYSHKIIEQVAWEEGHTLEQVDQEKDYVYLQATVW